MPLQALGPVRTLSHEQQLLAASPDPGPGLTSVCLKDCFHTVKQDHAQIQTDTSFNRQPATTLGAFNRHFPRPSLACGTQQYVPQRTGEAIKHSTFCGSSLSFALTSGSACTITDYRLSRRLAQALSSSLQGQVPPVHCQRNIR